MSCACTYSSVPRATSQGRAPTPASLSRITVLSSKHHLHGAANSLCNLSGKAHRSRGQRLRCQAAGFGGFGGGGGKPDKKVCDLPETGQVIEKSVRLVYRKLYAHSTMS